MVYKHMRMDFQKQKEVFVANILLYKNLSHFLTDIMIWEMLMIL